MVPVKTLANPEEAGQKGRKSSWQISSATAARPSSSATQPPACHAPLLPALIRCSMAVFRIALITMSPTMIVPSATFGRW